MKVRSQHVIALVLLLIGGFIVVAVLRSKGPVPEGERRPPEGPLDLSTTAITAPADGEEDDFLRKVHELQAVTPPPAGVGALPPVDADPTLVPMIDVETRDLDVGVIANNEIYRTPFKVFNRGKAPLKVSDVRTNCACTQGIVPGECVTIPPGGESYIEVAVLPNRIPGFYSKKTLTIFSNDPKEPSIEVHVIAAIDPEFELEPEVIDFGEVQKGQSPEAVMVFRQLAEQSIEVNEVTEFGQDPEDSGPGALELSFVARPESVWRRPGKAEYEITVGLSPSLSPGPFTRYFKILSTVKRVPLMRCKAKGSVIAFYSVDPALPRRLMLQKTPPEAKTASATATVTADRPIELTDIQTDSPLLVVSPRQGESPQVAHLDVSMVPGAPPGRLDAVLRFAVKAADALYRERIQVRALTRETLVPPAAG